MKAVVATFNQEKALVGKYSNQLLDCAEMFNIPVSIKISQDSIFEEIF